MNISDLPQEISILREGSTISKLLALDITPEEAAEVIQQEIMTKVIL